MTKPSEWMLSMVTVASMATGLAVGGFAQSYGNRAAHCGAIAVWTRRGH